MLMEYEMMLRISRIKAQKGMITEYAERVLATCMSAWNDYVWNAMEFIKRELDKRSVVRIPYQNSVVAFNPNNMGPAIISSLDYEEFRRDDMLDGSGNISDLSLRLAATMFCKKQIERQLKA